MDEQEKDRVREGTSTKHNGLVSVHNGGLVTCASGSSLSSSSSSGSSPPLAPVAASVIGSSPCPPSFGSAVSSPLDETAAPSVQAPSDSEGMAV